MKALNDRHDVELQSRDLALLRELLDSRLMTIKHAAALFFGGSREAAKKRLQKLRRAGLIVQRPRRPQDPAIFLMGRVGYLRLQQEGMIDPTADQGWPRIWKRRQIGDLMLRHELAVMDAKVSIVSAIKEQPHLELIEMSVSPDRHQFRVVQTATDSKGQIRFRSIYAKPDGFIHIREREDNQTPIEHFFFMEVDRGTEALHRVRQKATHYGQYYRKGGFAVRLGNAREDFKQFPFRVLMAFKTAERRNNVAEQLLKVGKPIKSQVWLTTMKELTGAPLNSIWIRPIDCKTVFEGMECGLDAAKTLAGDSRCPHREVKGEERIGKMRLFETES